MVDLFNIQLEQRVSWKTRTDMRPKIEVTCIECKALFHVATAGNYDPPAFCLKCANKTCKKCYIVLSKNYLCKCGEYHGMPSAEMPDFYCAKCIIYINQ